MMVFKDLSTDYVTFKVSSERDGKDRGKSEKQWWMNYLDHLFKYCKNAPLHEKVLIQNAT